MRWWSPVWNLQDSVVKNKMLKFEFVPAFVLRGQWDASGFYICIHVPEMLCPLFLDLIKYEIEENSCGLTIWSDVSCAPTDNEALFDSNLEVFPPAVPQVYVAEDKARHCTCPQVCLFAQRDFIQIVTQHFLRCWSHGHIQKSSMRHRHKKFNSVYRLHDRFQNIIFMHLI